MLFVKIFGTLSFPIMFIIEQVHELAADAYY